MGRETVPKERIGGGSAEEGADEVTLRLPPRQKSTKAATETRRLRPEKGAPLRRVNFTATNAASNDELRPRAALENVASIENKCTDGTQIGPTDPQLATK